MRIKINNLISCLVTTTIFTLFLCACEEKLVDGDWDPMELDKEELIFTSDGGEQKVVVLNYNHWWISGAYTDMINVDGKFEYLDYIYPTYIEDEDKFSFNILDGGWYHVSVPNKGLSNTAVIKVDSNDTNQPRQAVIIMTAGDVFTNINISQK